MKKSKLFIFIFIFILFFGINIEVLARQDPGGGGNGTPYSYGIRCFYSGKLKSYDTYNPTASGRLGSENDTNTPFIYGIEFHCTNKNCNSFVAWGHGRGAHINGSELLKVEFDNYDQLFKSSDTSVRDKAFGAMAGKGVKKCPSKLYTDSTFTTSAVSLMSETDYIGNAWWEFGGSYKKKINYANSYRFSEDDGGSLEQDVIDMVTGLKEITTSGGKKYDTTHGAVGDEIKDNANQLLVESIQKWAENKRNTQKNADIDIDVNDNLDCSQVLGESFVQVLSSALLLICISGVVILIFMMSSDFIKSITSGEADAMAESFKKSKTRIIATIILLLLPILVNFIINILNNNFRIEEGNIKIGDISECNVSKAK